ncbi:hypothetical protein N7495_003260 [Penicillium taxi]|uniref:uncharacterized protein n=1 Tax=Penicillium taxi TaxID=168475 RepID=UPI00254524CB|nr:uncharacterized protein N7495_003260 [Penicillium taxi]KAJ5902732.1 hypothetical protein N7495_003260 [Penicillium taxi]
MMHITLTVTLLFALALFSTATPIPGRHHKHNITLTESQVLDISPKANTCDDAPAEGECATAKTAAQFTSSSFNTYQVTSKAEQAAIISLIAFESGDFKYNKNHFPGVAGQGTRNMQSPSFNKIYASSIPALKDKLAAVSDSPADLLDLLRDDETYDFGSGAWFLTTQCSSDVRQSLQTGSEAGWEKYITQCIGTFVTDDRKAYWNRAISTLGVQSS